MRKKIFLLFVLGAVFARAQSNLIPNPSFEKVKSTPRNVGELHKASPWLSPTDGTADVFSKKTSNEEIGAPKNALGEQQARSGVNYSGAIFFSKKTNSTREYMQVELLKPLEAGRTYCLEFFVSLSDLSKYGIDRIGVYFSEEQISSKSWDPLNYEPQISNIPGRILAEQSQWEIICGSYQAKGGEKYMTIGNFYVNEQTKIKKLKKPAKIKGSQNEYGYYYIDDVSLKDIDDVGISCGCEKKMKFDQGNNQMNYVYSKVSGEQEEELDADEILQNKLIFFDEGKAELIEQSKMDINLIKNLLQEHGELKLAIEGFAEEAELKVKSDISLLRANAVKNELLLAGINPVRLRASAAKQEIPLKETKPGMLRKVVFSVIEP